MDLLNWMRRIPFTKRVEDQLHEAQIHRLAAEANYERSRAELIMYQDRVLRLLQARETEAPVLFNEVTGVPERRRNRVPAE